jgi:hypothetical protein
MSSPTNKITGRRNTRLSGCVFFTIYNVLQCVVLLFQGFSNLFRNAACSELDCYHGIDPNALGSKLLSHTNKFSAAQLSPF